MKNMKTKKHKNYPFLAAGRVWIIPEVSITILPDNTMGLSLAEIKRIQKAIANEVCGSPGPLSIEELEFLCDATATRYNEIAEKLFVSKSNVTFWRKSAKRVPLLESLFLKRWFWCRLFGTALGKFFEHLPTEAIADESKLLSAIKDRAIKEHLTFALRC
jgi:hypothetical protein